MSTDHSAYSGPRIPWAGKQVRIEQVEGELSYLWKLSADNVRTGQNIHVRTSVLNLIICAPDIATAQRASTVMRELASTHIARILILILDGSSDTSELFTWVTLRSFPIISDIMRHSFEQITVMASGQALRSAATIVQPLLKPDLPVYLWWVGDPPSTLDLFKHLVQLSNRIIVDSSSFFTPEQSIQNLSLLLQQVPNAALSDFNWGRLTSWRELIAQFFDMAEYKPYLAGVDHIEIVHTTVPSHEHVRTEQGDVSPNPTRALLLAGWLKTRLGWNFSSDPFHNQHDSDTGTHLWHMVRTTGALSRSLGPLVAQSSGSSGRSTRGGTRESVLHVRPETYSDMRPGSIALVRLISTVEGRRATFTVGREDDPDHVLTSVELGQEIRLQRTVSMTATHKESELLNDELEIMGRDYLYEEALHEVVALLEA